MLKVYGHPFASFYWKAAIALYERNVPFEFLMVEPQQVENSEAIRRLAPTGQFPVLVDGDRVVIVDYEYAGMGDVFFDLGNLAINNGLDDEARERLLHLYFLDDVLDHHRARLALMTLMSDFREAMWGVVQQALSDLDFDFRAYADQHFERLQRTAAERAFRRALS